MIANELRADGPFPVKRERGKFFLQTQKHFFADWWFASIAMRVK